jgi:hypothetical protein
MKGILARFIRRKQRTYEARDRLAMFEARALRLCNRDRDAAAQMVRKLVILDEGRK